MNDIESSIVSLDPKAASGANNPAYWAQGPGIGNFGLSPRFSRWLAENIKLYDALIIHGIWQYHSIATALAARESGVKVFVMPHGMLDPWFQRAHPLKHLKKLVYWYLAERFVFDRADKILFTCAEELNLARQSFLKRLDGSKLEVVGLGIDDPMPCLKMAAARGAEGYQQEPYILFLGRIHPKKALDVVVEGFARASQVSGSLRLKIAGPGESSFVAELKALADSLAIGDRIDWVGMVHGEAKWHLLAGAELFVLPSHQENFGIAVVESLAMGTPVLISKSVNIWREICSGDSGIACDDNVPSFSAALQEWFKSTNGVKSIAAKDSARNTFESVFQMTAVADRLAMLLKAP